ncbi:uncharacterized protein G2W53_001069 [Senna tora]|uniref:Uncharacterized protein n=1 Tax=Senna tora TaxID=362788 RepID=A0A834XF82_9FABA|nr:uncharacterized protein G2W53_001069 [Senna tora]
MTKVIRQKVRLSIRNSPLPRKSRIVRSQKITTARNTLIQPVLRSETTQKSQPIMETRGVKKKPHHKP